jgi:hypothetical protein
MRGLLVLAAAACCLTVVLGIGKPPTTPVAEPKATDSARIAVLNLGTPGVEGIVGGEELGKEIRAEDFELVVPMLEKERVDIVVIRVNTGLCEGRSVAAETARFVEVFTKEFEPRFRTVAWIESAVDASAVAVWPLDELYFMSHGNMGAALLVVGRMKAAEGEEFAAWLKLGETGAKSSGRDPKIMRSMQSTQPLSATIDEHGEVHWFADLSGERVVNRDGRVLTLDSHSAEKLKISHGTIDSKEALADSMGVKEAVWVGEEAAASIRAAVAKRRSVEPKEQR